jgi:putative transposase
VFERNAHRYGTCRLRAELYAEGQAVGRYALRTWLRCQGLQALTTTTRPQLPRTIVANPAALVAENLLLGQPAPACTCGLTRGRADAHLTGAYGLGTSLITLRQPPPGLIVHADRGSQYTSAACQQRITDASGFRSFSQPGSPYYNAQEEAGWSTLKTELLPFREPFASFEKARLEIAYYLDTYFNLDRRYSTLVYSS